MENRFKITQPTIESTTDQHQKRIIHNNSEKQRKEKIKSKIENIGHLLPRIRDNEKQSTLAILERAADFITEIQDKNDQLMCDNGVEVQTEEIHSLRQELDNIKSQRDRLTDLIKTAGISSLLNSSWKGRKADSTSNSSDSRHESADTTSNVLQASSKKDKETEGPSKSSKVKRHNTIYSQLESIANKKQIAKLAQETNAKMNSGNILMPSLNNFNGMQTTNILPAGINQQQIFAATPNLLNTSLSNAILASSAQGQVIFSNANSAGSFVNLQGSSTQPSVAFVSPSSNLLANSEKGNGDGSGLLQIAMRDAGITSVTQPFITPPQLPQITSQAQQAMISSITNTNAETMISADSSQGQQPTPQQTLTSVVSNTQSMNTGFINSPFFSGNNCFQQGSNPITNTTQAINSQVPIMSIGQSNYNQILQNGNALINVPIMNAPNQSLPVGGTLSGIGGLQGLQTGQGQIVLVNDHGGLSLMPNYQMVVDPTTLTLANNSRQFSNDKVVAQKLGHAVDQAKMALTNVINNTEVMNHAATLPVQNQPQAPQQSIALQNAINAQTLTSNPHPAMQQLAFQPAQQTISLGATNSVIQQAQMNNHLSAQQQQMLSTPYANANTNFLNTNPGLVLPVSQNGNLLTLNTVPSQPNQLPTALILPNGHIIPVVTQPQVLLQQQLQQQQIQQQLLNVNCQLQAAVAAQTQTMHPSQIPAKLAVVGNLGNNNMPNNNMPIIDSNLTTILNPQNVQCQNQSALLQSQQKPPMGLLMTTTISNFPMSNAATTVASINNNMVTTSATQSVMTTQVQASQMHRPTSAPAFVKRSETQTSESKGVVMSTTGGSLMQFRTPNTSTPDNSILLGNMSQTNLQTTVGTVPSQNDSSIISSSLPTSFQSSLPVNQSGQINGPNGSILITFGPPGQQACCILNPNSMQGLGNISNQQPALPAISTIPTTISSTNPTVSSKKNNKKNSQRTIVPKPPKANQTNPLPSVCSMNSSNSVSSTQVSVSSTLWNSTPMSSDQEASSTTMQNVVSTNDICVSTTAESTIIQSPSTSNISENTGTTDILAKAAESIFSSSLQDISPPISSFYNPANEDNPLHIDTSAGETEDDCSAQSPSKESCDSDHVPTSSHIEMEVETQSAHSVDNACSNLTVSSPSTFFKESDICESIGAVSKRGQLKSKIIEPEKEKSKKDFKKLPNSKRITKKPVSIAISEAINFASNQFSGVLDQVESVSIEKKKQKALNKELVRKSLKVPVKKQTPSVDIPDEIVFMESEISDVLDQVENLRNTWANENDQRKNKKRKGKSNCAELDSDQLIMNKKKKPQIKNQESLIEVEEIKINSSECDNSIAAEENPSELLSPDSTTVTKTVSNYTASSTDESPSGSNGESTCEKNVNYDPYDITLALEESEPIKSFRSIDSSKTFCQPNSSQIVASYPGKMIEKPQSSPTEITCTTSLHSHNNQGNRLSNRLSPTSTGGTSSNCISSNANSKNNRSRSNSIIDQKSLQLTCNSQPTSSEDTILSKNTYSNRQLTAGSQTVSASTMSLTRSQQHSYNRQSQHIAQPSLSQVSVPSSITHISTAVEPETNSSVSQNVISNSSAQIASPCTSEQSNYSSPNSLRYSAESLFNSSNKLNTPQPKSHPQPLNQTMIPQDSSNIISNSIAGDTASAAVTLPSSKSRNLSIYSAENFVHSGRHDNSRIDKNTYSSGSVFSSNNAHHLATSENDALSFANLGLTLTPTIPSNTFTDSSVCNSSTSFTFSLTNSNNSSLFPSHHFPFLHLHSLVTPQLLHGENNESSNNQQSQTFGLPSFGLNNQKNNNEAESNIPHQNNSNEQNIICGSSSSSSTTSSHLQSHNTFNFGLSNSLETCSIPRSQPYTDGSNVSLNTTNLEKTSSNTIIQSNDGVRTISNQKHLPNIPQSISLTNRTQQPGLNSVDCSSQITSNVSTYFSPMNYQSLQSLHTPPLHHPPVTSNENSRANISRSFNANLPTSISNFGSSAPVFNSRFDSNQLLFHSQRDTAVSQNVNINPEISKSTSQQQNTVSKTAKQQAFQQTLPLSQSQLSQGSLSSHHSTPSSMSDNAILTIPHSNPPPQPSHTSQQQQHQHQQHQQQQQQQQQQRSTKQTSRTKQSQSKKNKQSLSEVDSNLSQSIFDQNMALYFPINNTSPPPPRTIQGDTPTFLSGNLFTSSARQIPNTSSAVLKSSDISTSFNSIFPPSRSQNGIGLNFQTGFGMNTVHSGPSNTPQIPPHSSVMPNLPHVPSLGLGNIFSDVNSTSQNEALNISPIKFPTNSILPPPQASIDPNSLQHHHQSGALYHNRSHPPPPVIHNMSINSILSHNPHGFEPRGPVTQAINSTVTPSGFHGPSHSSFPIPPLNFSIHEH